MSFREKTAWISLVSIGAVYGFYFLRLRSSPPLLATVIALVVIQTVLTVIAAVLAPREANQAADERERFIEMNSTRFAYWVLAGSIACACFFAGFPSPLIFTPNSLLFVLVAAEILRFGCQIVQYRRGA